MKRKLIRAAIAITGCILLVVGLSALGVTGAALTGVAIAYGFIAGWNI